MIRAKEIPPEMAKLSHSKLSFSFRKESGSLKVKGEMYLIFLRISFFVSEEKKVNKYRGRGMMSAIVDLALLFRKQARAAPRKAISTSRSRKSAM